MKIMQEITLSPNCESCIERAEAAGIGFTCLALDARAALRRVNDEAAGLTKLELTRSDIATPLIRQMLGAAVARSVSDTSLPSPIIRDVEQKMADCAGPLIEHYASAPASGVAKSLVFSQPDYVKDAATGETITAAASAYSMYDTSLLDPSKYQWKTFLVGNQLQKGIVNTGGTMLTGDYHSAEVLQRSAQAVLKAAEAQQ